MKLAPKGMYYTGWYRRNRTAVFQFSRCLDSMSCELVQFFGLIETKKEDARVRLKADKARVLVALQLNYPKYNLRNVVIE